jgi:DNA processing protein
VVEAPERSGAGITARQAGDQGREVMAVPGPVDLEAAEGCNALIRDGAALVRHARDVLETVPALRELADESIPPWTPPDPTSRAGRIVAALRQGGGGSLDQLCRHTGLPTIELLPCLTELEQAGVLQRQAGLYRLA